MKTKIFALLLAVLTVLPLLVGCSNETQGAVTGESERNPMTLSLWLPSEKAMSAETIKAVQDAVNKLTTAKYQTALQLNFIPTEKYQAALDAKLGEIKAARDKAEADKKKNKNKKNTEAAATVEEETYEISNGYSVVKYPAVSSTQLDLFLVRGYDKYYEYYDNEVLIELDSMLSGDGKLMKEYIYPTFFDYAKLDGKLYAIPNNHQIGEYDFLLINKRLVDELYYDIDLMGTLNECKTFILDVAENTDVTPILAPAGPQTVVSISSDGKQSVLGFQELSGTSNMTWATLSNVFRLPEYTDNIYNMKYYAEQGFFAEDPDNCEEFGVAVIHGGAEIYDQYGEDYFVKVYNRPTARNEDIFGAMIGICDYSKDPDRAMEILTMINTDPELRTVLQYGVEGVHWAENDDGTIRQLNGDYVMNLVETGNTFITYPGYNRSMDEWEYAKTANLESTTSPFLGFTGYVNEYTEKHFKEIEKISADIFPRIEKMSAQEFKDALADIRKEINASESFKWLITTDTETDPNAENNVIMLYHDWYVALGRKDPFDD